MAEHERDLVDTAPSRDGRAALDEIPALRLIVLSGQEPAAHALPSSGSVVIGRSSFADIAIDDPSVSRRHAEIHIDDDEELSIEDLGSANGTHVQGRELASGIRAPFAEGEVIELGDVSVVVASRGLRRAPKPASRAIPEPASADLRDSDGRPIIVCDPVMLRLHRLLERVAPSEISVLILGETGTGKEIIAKRLHALSPRASRPLLEINCASIPETLLESELFGHDRGAFTGALKAKPGLFEAANGGTVFLDEIGEMPLAVQAKLLRVVETKRVTRLGEIEARAIDVRFVAATHRDVEAAVASGTFRSDLYFRMNGISLHLPPLRERASEIEPLAEAVLASWARSANRAVPLLGVDALERLHQHAWPGNIRELIRVLERAAILAEGPQIQSEHLELGKRKDTRPPDAPIKDAKAEEPIADLRSEVAVVEKEAIERALDTCGGNQTRAAEMLGISRRTLGNRMDEFNLRRPRKGKSS